MHFFKKLGKSYKSISEEKKKEKEGPRDRGKKGGWNEERKGREKGKGEREKEEKRQGEEREGG